MFLKISVPTNFAQFTEKHQCRSLFFNEAAGLRLQLYKKRDTGTGVFPEFQEHGFNRTPAGAGFYKVDINFQGKTSTIQRQFKYGLYAKGNGYKNKATSTERPTCFIRQIKGKFTYTFCCLFKNRMPRCERI